MTTPPPSDNGATVRRLLARLAPEADLDALSPDADLREALQIDSFDFLNFLVGLERELGVSVPETDYGKVTTLNSLTSYLAARPRAAS